MKIKRKIIYILVFLFAFICLGTIKSNAGSLYLNSLDFKAKINSDGSMDVTENWNIQIKNTNTLYKTFETDDSKYSQITDVTVKEITNGQTKAFTKIDEWVYHADKDHYYGTKNSDGNFEIGWGVGLDSSSATRKYEISYTVKDAIKKYNDYAELYWQFIGDDFEINCDRITGKIYLPSDAKSTDEIKVWGHTKDLNGEIYATSTNKIKFEVNNYRSGRYVEVRTLFPTDMIFYSKRKSNTDILAKAIEEETKWANKANTQRKIAKSIPIILLIVYIAINVILVIVYIKKAIKYSKKLKGLNKCRPTTQLEYYRDLPSEDATPGEAVKILNIDLSEFAPTNFGKIFSATILDLTLKGYLEVSQDKKEKGKDNINIRVLKQISDELKPDEKYIMEFIANAAKGKESITIKELEKFIKDRPKVVEKLLNDSYRRVRDQLVEQQIIDREIEKEYKKYKEIQTGYIFAIIFILCFTLIAFILPVIILVIDAIMCSKIAKKLNVLTQKGVDAQEEWKGLKKYMEDFSMLDKREVPELVIWEKYLVYATAFGIADKVIKQLKMVYPSFNEISETNLSTYTYMNLMMTTNFSSSFSNAMSSSISSSIASTYSSGSGGGGGFSGGGGFGRRPVEAEAGR